MGSQLNQRPTGMHGGGGGSCSNRSCLPHPCSIAETSQREQNQSIKEDEAAAGTLLNNQHTNKCQRTGRPRGPKAVGRRQLLAYGESTRWCRPRERQREECKALHAALR